MLDALYLISSRQGFIAEAEKAVSSATTRIGARAALANGSTAGPAVEAFRSGAASVILLDLDSELDEAMQVLTEIHRLAPEACVLAASARRDPDLILSAMRAGAADFLSLPLEALSFGSALQRVRGRRTSVSGSEPVSRGRVISFLAAKGGTGATTLAVNMAVAIRNAESAGSRSVVLVDLDYPGGDISAMLKLAPTYSLADVAANVRRLDMDLLGSLMLQHSSGVYVIPAADEGELPAAVEGHQVAGVVGFLREHFDTVILAGGGFSEPAMAALNQAHVVHVVSTLDFLSLRRTQAALRRLREFGVAGDGLRVVINRHDRGGDLTLADAREALGMPVAWSVPNDSRSAEKSVNEGVPVVTLGKGKLQASIDEYAGKLAGSHDDRPVSGFTGLFRRLVPTRAAAAH